MNSRELWNDHGSRLEQVLFNTRVLRHSVLHIDGDYVDNSLQLLQRCVQIRQSPSIIKSDLLTVAPDLDKLSVPRGDPIRREAVSAHENN